MTDYVGDVTCVCGNTVKDVITGGFYRRCEKCNALLSIQTDGEKLWPNAIVDGHPETKPEFIPGTISLAELTK
jgi:hypothetical protein